MAAMPDVLGASPLTLVRWRPEDVDEVLEAVRTSFAELQQLMHWAQTLPTREQQREALTEGNTAFDAGTDFGFLFRETATGALVGGGGVHRRMGPGAVEIAYWVRSDRHNRGYATRATEAMTDAAFTYLAGVDRFEIHMDRANIASARVTEKLGHRLLRTRQQEKLALGHTGQGYVWQKRRDEWTPPPRTWAPVEDARYRRRRTRPRSSARRLQPGSLAIVCHVAWTRCSSYLSLDRSSRTDGPLSGERAVGRADRLKSKGGFRAQRSET